MKNKYLHSIQYIQITNSGFTLLEIIVSMAIAAIILPALGAVFTFSLNSSSVGEKTSKANIYAQEQMEAVYQLKDSWTWTTTDPANTSNTEYYQPCKNSSGVWNLGTKTNSPVEDPCATGMTGFKRTIQIFSVTRNSDGSLGGTTENKETRKVVSKVTWVDKDTANPEEVSLSSYVTKH